jgi:LemA protein
MEFLLIDLAVSAGIVLLWLLLTYNSLVNRRNQVRYSFAGMDVQLKQRHDLVPNLVETVKGYAAHEREVFESVTRARSEAAAPGAGWPAQENLQRQIGTLIARAEAYPELKSDSNFVMLQRQLAECEAQIAAARRAYNASIMDYNNAVQMVPSSLVAGMFGFREMPSFEIAVEERATPHVRF